jgi:rSAM/selenodomain-associated transferase 2
MVSVIIPVLNDVAPLRTLLKRLANEPGPIEIIVADGGSSDGTAALERQFPWVRWTAGPPGRGRQMNAGARLSRGEVLLFLHCDTQPPPGAIAELPALLAPHGADFGAFRIGFDPPVWLPQLLAQTTRLASPWCCFGDQGIFARREFFFASSGFPEIPLLEDVHWVRAAGRLGRMVRSRHVVLSSARRFEKIGTVRQSLRNLSILVRDLFGQDPAYLARLYDRDYHAGPLAVTPTIGGGALPRKGQPLSPHGAATSPVRSRTA